MKKNIFLNFYLLYAMLLLSINTAYSQDHLTVYIWSEASSVSTALDNIEQLSFSDDNLSVKTYDGNSAVYALDNIEKLRFENEVQNACPNLITGFAASNITENSITVDWNYSGTAAQWDIEYGLTGFTLGTGISKSSSSKSYVITGLSTNTTYDIYVRSICSDSDKSDWSKTTVSTPSVNDIEQILASGVSIYPNPTTGIVYLNSVSHIKVYSQQGELLQEKTGDSVDLSGYAAGLYLLQVGNEWVKVVKI